MPRGAGPGWKAPAPPGGKLRSGGDGLGGVFCVEAVPVYRLADAPEPAVLRIGTYTACTACGESPNRQIQPPKRASDPEA